MATMRSPLGARSMTGMGHQDAFPRPRLSARYLFSQETFVGIITPTKGDRISARADEKASCGTAISDASLAWRRADINFLA